MPFAMPMICKDSHAFDAKIDKSMYQLRIINKLIILLDIIQRVSVIYP
jgi:hypothetical protein